MDIKKICIYPTAEGFEVEIVEEGQEEGIRTLATDLREINSILEEVLDATEEDEDMLEARRSEVLAAMREQEGNPAEIAREGLQG